MAIEEQPRANRKQSKTNRGSIGTNRGPTETNLLIFEASSTTFESLDQRKIADEEQIKMFSPKLTRSHNSRGLQRLGRAQPLNNIRGEAW